MREIIADYFNSKSGRMLELKQGLDRIILTPQQQVTIARMIVIALGKKAIE